MAEFVCLDASVYLKLYLPEPGSMAAERLLDGVLDHGQRLIGPAFLPAEVLSVVRRCVHQGVMTPGQAEVVLGSFLSLPIESVDGREVYERAWRIAADLDLPVLYDAVYLAVAALRGALFWTADQALQTRAQELPYIQLLPSTEG